MASFWSCRHSVRQTVAFGIIQNWIQNSPLSFTNCMNLSELLNFSKPLSSFVKMIIGNNLYLVGLLWWLNAMFCRKSFAQTLSHSMFPRHSSYYHCCYPCCCCFFFFIKKFLNNNINYFFQYYVWILQNLLSPYHVLGTPLGAENKIINRF